MDKKQNCVKRDYNTLRARSQAIYQVLKLLLLSQTQVSDRKVQSCG